MIAYLDLAGGLSGDMTIAAFLSAGADEKELVKILKLLPLGRWELIQEDVHVFGLTARRVSFRTDHHPPHRHFSDIRDGIVGPAPLPERVKTLSLGAFEALARAEAKIHGSEMDRVHFHEVGADDSILDLVGAAACLEILGVTRLVASPVPLARGQGACQHGPMPLPAPAAMELLKDRPVYGVPGDKELVTPTAAAILTWAEAFGDLPAMTLKSVGVCVGQRVPQPDRPGLTRLFLGEPAPAVAWPLSEKVVLLTTAIDDMNPELYGPLLDRLLARGALDVQFTPAQMKKNRPGVRLEVLARPDQSQTLAALILEETTTLGVRTHLEDRFCLERKPGQVQVSGHPVAGKWARRPSGRWEFRPEFEACRELADRLQKPVGLIFERALLAAQGQEP